MNSELQMILDERKYDTVPLHAHITKSTEETIYRYAKYYNLDFDVALEMIIQSPPSQEEWKKIGSTI